LILIKARLILNRQFFQSITETLRIDDILDLSIKVLKNIENLFSDQPDSDDLSKSLLQFNLYRELFSSIHKTDSKLLVAPEEFHKKMSLFYEKCRGLHIAKNDPLFVIQLSMSYLNNSQFAECYPLIESARKMCRPRYDQFQIDTHHADVILQEALLQDEYIDFVKVGQAFDFVTSVIERKSERYHPFAVAKKFLSFIEKHQDILLKKRKNDIAIRLNKLQKLAEKFPDDIRDNYSFIGMVSRKISELSENFK
jgi:hypothetical protein